VPTMNNISPIKTIALGILFALACIELSACSRSEANANQVAKNPEVGVVTIQARPLTLSSELPGRTTAFMIAQIRPQIGGIVQKRVFTEGSLVKTGDLLYQIDPATYQAAYDSAKATLAKSEATLASAALTAKRNAALLAIDAISTQTNDDAQAALKEDEAAVAESKAALETASINLQYTRITSPISGRIETSTVTPGALVTAAQTTALTTVQQLDPIYVDIPQSSVDVLKLRQAIANGSLKTDSQNAVAIKLKLEDGTAYSHLGKLQSTGTTVDTTTGSITLRALVPNPEHLLMPGMYVRATLDKGTDPQALLVPQKGVTRDSTGKATAMVVNKNGQIEVRNITVAEAVGHDWHVTSGLAAGERIVVEGTSKVRAGQTVDAVEVAGTADGNPVAAASTPATAAAVVAQK
jgi:membrane fusion protein, multidrug efflux system